MVGTTAAAPDTASGSTELNGAVAINATAPGNESTTTNTTDTANTSNAANTTDTANASDTANATDTVDTDEQIAYLRGDGSERTVAYVGGEIIVVGAPIEAAHDAGEESVALRRVEEFDDGEVVDSSREATLSIETSFDEVPFDPGDADTPTGEPPTAFVRIEDDESLAVADYILRDDGQRVAETRPNTIEVVEQSLTAEWDGESFDRGDDTTAELELDSTRATYNVNVSAPGLEYEELEALFLPDDAADEWLDTNAPRTERAPFPDAGAGVGLNARLKQASVHADEDVIVLRGYNDGTLKADPIGAELDPATIEFNITATDSAAETTAPLTVTDTDADAAFDRSEYRTPAGGLLNVTVNLEGTESTYLVVGGPDGGYLDVVYLEDDTGDGTVEVLVNTRLIGTRPARNAPGGDDAFVSDTDIVRSLAATNGTAPPASLGEAFEGLRFEDEDETLVPATDDGSDGSLNAFRTELGLRPLVRPLQPGGYELRLTTDGALTATEAGHLQVDNDHDIAHVELTDPDIGPLYTHVAPPAAADDVGLEPLIQSMTPRETVALGDRLIIQFDAGSYTGALAASAVETGNVNTQRELFSSRIEGETLQRMLEAEGEGLTLELAETTPTGNREPDQLRFDGVDEEALSAYLGADAETLYLVVDTGRRSQLFDRSLASKQYTARLAYEADADDRYRFATEASAAASGDEHGSDIRFDAAAPFGGGAAGDPAIESYPYLQAGEAAASETQLTFAEPTVRLNQTTDGTTFVQRDGNAALVGTTNVAPGVPLQVLVDGRRTIEDSGARASPFSTATETTVGVDGTVETTLNTTDGTVGQELVLTVQSGSRSVTERNAQLVDALATVSLQERFSVDRQLDTVTVEAALPTGGFVGIHDSQFADHGQARADSLRGVSRYLDPSSSERVEIRLDEPYRRNDTVVAVLYRDSPRNRRFDLGDDTESPYMNRGASITDTATVSVSQPPTTARAQLPEAPPPAAPPNRDTAAATGPSAGGNNSVTRTARTPVPAQSAANASATTNSTVTNSTTSEPERIPERHPGLGALMALLAVSVAALLRHRQR